MEMWQAHWFTTSPQFPSLSWSLPPFHSPTPLSTCLILSIALCRIYHSKCFICLSIFLSDNLVHFFILHNNGRLMGIMTYSISKTDRLLFFFNQNLICQIETYVFHFSKMPLQFVWCMNGPTNGFPSLQNLIVSKKKEKRKRSCLTSTNVMSEVFSMYKAKLLLNGYYVLYYNIGMGISWSCLQTVTVKT